MSAALAAMSAALAAMSALAMHLRGLVLTLPWLLGLFVADVALSLLLPLSPLAPRRVYDASSRIAAAVWWWIQFIFVGLNGARIECSGHGLPPGESAVVVANHVAWADFYAIQALALRAGMLGRCRYFAKRQLRLVPFLGWGLWAMGMPLVSRNWLTDQAELDAVFSAIARERRPVWLISFSEATRFTATKYRASQAWAKENDRPQPQHLLCPRTKGFVATVQHLRRTAPHVRAVYDVGIAYARGHGRVARFQQPPSMWETLSAPGLSSRRGYRFRVDARRFAMDSLPESDDGLARWLEERWVVKGEWLESQRRAWLSASPAGA